MAATATSSTGPNLTVMGKCATCVGFGGLDKDELKACRESLDGKLFCHMHAAEGHDKELMLERERKAATKSLSEGQDPVVVVEPKDMDTNANTKTKAKPKSKKRKADGKDEAKLDAEETKRVKEAKLATSKMCAEFNRLLKHYHQKLVDYLRDDLCKDNPEARNKISFDDTAHMYNLVPMQRRKAELKKRALEDAIYREMDTLLVAWEAIKPHPQYLMNVLMLLVDWTYFPWRLAFLMFRGLVGDITSSEKGALKIDDGDIPLDNPIEPKESGHHPWHRTTVNEMFRMLDRYYSMIEEELWSQRCFFDLVVSVLEDMVRRKGQMRHDGVRYFLVLVEQQFVNPDDDKALRKDRDSQATIAARFLNSRADQTKILDLLRKVSKCGAKNITPVKPFHSALLTHFAMVQVEGCSETTLYTTEGARLANKSKAKTKRGQVKPFLTPFNAVIRITSHLCRNDLFDNFLLDETAEKVKSKENKRQTKAKSDDEDDADMEREKKEEKGEDDEDADMDVSDDEKPKPKEKKPAKLKTDNNEKKENKGTSPVEVSMFTVYEHDPKRKKDKYAFALHNPKEIDSDLERKFQFGMAFTVSRIGQYTTQRYQELYPPKVNPMPNPNANSNGSGSGGVESDLKAKILALEAKHSTLNGQVGELEKKKSLLDADFTKWSNESKAMDDRRAKILEESKTWSEQKAVLEGNKSVLEGEIKQLGEKKARFESDNLKLAEDKATLTTEIDQAREAKVKAEEACEAVKREIAQLEIDLAAKQQRRAGKGKNKRKAAKEPEQTQTQTPSQTETHTQSEIPMATGAESESEVQSQSSDGGLIKEKKPKSKSKIPRELRRLAAHNAQGNAESIVKA